MKRRVIKRPRAERDLVDHFIYIGRDNQSAAHLFLRDAEAAFEKIAELPGAGSVWESTDQRLENVRHRAVSRRFRNYLIFYRVADEFIEVFAIIHGARDLPSLLPDLP